MNMRTLLAVPTKGRIDTIGKDTLAWLPAAAKKMERDWILAVEPQEAKLYEKFYPQWKENLLILPENNKGLTYSLIKIKEYAIAHSYEAVFKIDDDMRGWYGRERKSGNTLKAFTRGLGACEEMLLRASTGIMAVSFPYSNHMFEVEKEWSERGRLQTCYLIRPEWWYLNPKMKDNDDFSAFISLRFQGFEVFRYNWLGMVCKPVAKNPGGLQMFNRRDTMIESNAILRQEFPDLKFRKVEGKPWDEEPDMRSVP